MKEMIGKKDWFWGDSEKQWLQLYNYQQVTVYVHWLSKISFKSNKNKYISKGFHRF